MNGRRHLGNLCYDRWIYATYPHAEFFGWNERFEGRNEDAASKCMTGEATVPVENSARALDRYVFLFNELFEIHFGVIESLTVLRSIDDTVFRHVERLQIRNIGCGSH